MIEMGAGGPLHPVVAARLSAAPPAASPSPVLEQAVAVARAEHLASTAGVVSRETPAVPARDLEVPGAVGHLRVREYRPSAVGGGPSLIFFHGGGWVTGTLDTYDDLCSRLAQELGGAVFSVDYPLAPEVRFPGAVEDADAAVRWLLGRAGELDLDPHRVWVGGDSAGGTLAAAVARRLRDEPPADGHRIAGQLLIYPVTDGAMSTASYHRFGQGYGLTAERMRWFWDLYCPDLDTRADPDASPLRVPDASGLPPLVLVLGTHDPLFDEGVAYASRLRSAGVPVSVTVAPGLVHGFIRWTAILDEAQEFIAQAGAIVRG